MREAIKNLALVTTGFVVGVVTIKRAYKNSLYEYTKIVVETDEMDSKVIATISANDIDSDEKYRVRLTPKY